MVRRTSSWMGFGVVAGSAIVADVATKLAALEYLDPSLRAGPASLRVVYNTGVAFGLAAGASTVVLLLVSGALAVLIAGLALRDDTGSSAALGMVFGGAVGNIGDRFVDGRVTDFIHFGWWPAFNLADVFIVSGIALMLIASVREPPRREAAGV